MNEKRQRLIQRNIENKRPVTTERQECLFTQLDELELASRRVSDYSIRCQIQQDLKKLRKAIKYNGIPSDITNRIKKFKNRIK